MLLPATTDVTICDNMTPPAPLQAFNSETGEVYDVAITHKAGLRHTFPEGFAYVGIGLLRKLGTIGLKGKGFEFAICLFLNTERGGICLKRSSHIGAMIGVNRAASSRFARILEDNGILVRLHNRTILVNPIYFFIGDSKEQHRAIQQWSEAKLQELTERRFGNKA